MDPELKVPNHVVEEYEALRTEMIRHMESLDRNVIATITATAVAIAYGLKESPFVLVLPIIIPIYFWIQHVNNRRKLAKISSYIAVFLRREQSVDVASKKSHADVWAKGLSDTLLFKGFLITISSSDHRFDFGLTLVPAACLPPKFRLVVTSPDFCGSDSDGGPHRTKD